MAAVNAETVTAFQANALPTIRQYCNAMLIKVLATDKALLEIVFKGSVKTDATTGRWFGRCWNVGWCWQQLPTMQRRAVYYGKDTTHKTL